MVSALPCAAMTIWSLYLYFWADWNRKVSEDLMSLGLYGLWLLPLAIISLVLACFSRGWRMRSLRLAMIYFVGWIVIIIVDCIGYH